MITANVSRPADDGRTVNLGSHRFAAVPHVGDHALLYVDGESFAAKIEAVFHNPVSLDGLGPMSDPSIMIVVSEYD